MSRRTYIIDLDGVGPYKVFPQFGKYAADGTLQIEFITDNDYEECLCEATTNIRFAMDGLNLDKTRHVLIKDYSENKGMVRELVKNNIINPTIIGNFKTGFVEVGLYQLSTDFLSYYSPMIHRALGLKEVV